MSLNPRAFLPFMFFFLTLNSYSQSAGINSLKDEKRFNEIIDNVASLYRAQITSLGKKFMVNKFWNQRTINASAVKLGNWWMLNVNGGLYQASAATDDSLALAVCHEIGHLLGGAPYLSNNTDSSTEGQADFWGAAICFKKYMTMFPDVVETTTEKILEICSKSKDQHLCERSLEASLAVAKIMVRGQLTMNFDSQELPKVTKTFEEHTDPLCRLQTFKEGTLCDLPFEDDQFMLSAYKNRRPGDYKCPTDIDGKIEYLEKRPACWYKVPE